MHYLGLPLTLKIAIPTLVMVFHLIKQRPLKGLILTALVGVFLFDEFIILPLFILWFGAASLLLYVVWWLFVLGLIIVIWKYM